MDLKQDQKSLNNEFECKKKNYHESKELKFNSD